MRTRLPPWMVLTALTGFAAVGACATGNTGESAVDDDGSGGNQTGGVGGTANSGGGSPGSGGNTSGPGGNGAGGNTSGPGGGNPGDPVLWINEIHYDNDGGDTNEGIEVAGTAGIDLSGFALELYNESSNYETLVLAGTVPNEGSGFGATWFAIAGVQNGPSDGVALIDRSNDTVVMFLSYEGTTVAGEGPAMGMSSVDMGVEETSTTPVGQSLQLTGSGSTYAAFTWSGPVASSPGTLNANQNVP